MVLTCEIHQGVINLFPPTRVCEEGSCTQGYKTSADYRQPQELSDERVYPVTVFTQAHGPLPGYAASLACPSESTQPIFQYNNLSSSCANQLVKGDTITIILFTVEKLFEPTILAVPFS